MSVKPTDEPTASRVDPSQAEPIRAEPEPNTRYAGRSRGTRKYAAKMLGMLADFPVRGSAVVYSCHNISVISLHNEHYCVEPLCELVWRRYDAGRKSYPIMPQLCNRAMLSPWLPKPTCHSYPTGPYWDVVSWLGADASSTGGDCSVL